MPNFPLAFHVESLKKDVIAFYLLTLAITEVVLSVIIVLRVLVTTANLHFIWTFNGRTRQIIASLTQKRFYMV